MYLRALGILSQKQKKHQQHEKNSQQQLYKIIVYHLIGVIR